MNKGKSLYCRYSQRCPGRSCGYWRHMRFCHSSPGYGNRGRAAVISTIGFAILQEKQQKFHKIIDTCGVSNLHGLPGIFGGLAAIVVIDGIDISAQLKGIAATI
jgi:hypothetical protein